MPSTATRCSSCGKWQKDISELRNKYYGAVTVCGLVAFFMFLGGRDGRWRQCQIFPLECGFSPDGLWYLLALGLVVSGAIGFKYYAEISRKIGSWWWV